MFVCGVFEVESYECLFVAKFFSGGEKSFFWNIVWVDDDAYVEGGETLQFKSELVFGEWLCLWEVSFFFCGDEWVGAALWQECAESVHSLVGCGGAELAGFCKASVCNVGVAEFAGEGAVWCAA